MVICWLQLSCKADMLSAAFDQPLTILIHIQHEVNRVHVGKFPFEQVRTGAHSILSLIVLHSRPQLAQTQTQTCIELQ